MWNNRTNGTEVALAAFAANSHHFEASNPARVKISDLIGLYVQFENVGHPGSGFHTGTMRYL